MVENVQHENGTLGVSLNKPEWDYTVNAEYYQFRPNYAPLAIDQMLDVAGSQSRSNFKVADVGAGTGNLTVLLLAKNISCVAIEPNLAMRTIGMERTAGQNVKWRAGVAEDTGLETGSVDLYAMGSSFNTTDRTKTLVEAHRTLKENGWFACMWNHRDLNDPTQSKVENIIREFFPSYSHGTRRENQNEFLSQCSFFGNLKYIEVSQIVEQPLKHYLLAWRSVKNQFWDLTTEEGNRVFSQIEKRIREELPENLNLNYTTRLWMVQRK